MPPPAPAVAERHTDWTFGELPELLETAPGRPDADRLSGADRPRTHVEIEVFDEPEVAAASTAPACAGWWRCRSASR
jgi:ATP-dependent helicase HrpA